MLMTSIEVDARDGVWYTTHSDTDTDTEDRPMTRNDLIETTRLAARAMSLLTVQNEMGRHPDADWDVVIHWSYPDGSWECVPEAVVTGNVYLGQVTGIEDIATGADGDSWVLDLTVDKILRGNIKLRLKYQAYQKYTDDEIELLTSIGVLKEDTYTPRPYRNLVCNIR